MARGWGRREETRLLTVRVFDVLGCGRGGIDAEDVVVRPRGIALTRHRHLVRRGVNQFLYHSWECVVIRAGRRTRCIGRRAG